MAEYDSVLQIDGVAYQPEAVVYEQMHHRGAYLKVQLPGLGYGFEVGWVAVHVMLRGRVLHDGKLWLGRVDEADFSDPRDERDEGATTLGFQQYRGSNTVFAQFASAQDIARDGVGVEHDK